MTLHHIVETVGGDLYGGGRQANIPGPGHSRHDRSVSLLYENGRVVVHGFSSNTWWEILDWLRELGLIDSSNRPISRHQTGGVQSGGAMTIGRTGVYTSTRIGAAIRSDAQRIDAARKLWDSGQEIAANTPGALHFAHRGHPRAEPLPGPDVVRFRNDTPLSFYDTDPLSRRLPALLVAIRDGAGTLTAVEVAYLTREGRKPVDLRVPRKTIGTVPPNTAVRIDPPEGEMIVAEGFFTALSARRIFRRPTWALLCVRNMASWVAPDCVHDVIIARDRGKPGQAAAVALARRLHEQRVASRIHAPPAPFDDWNQYDLAQARAVTPLRPSQPT